MTPIFLNPPPSPFPHLVEGDRDDHPQHLLFQSPSQAASSTSSSHLSFPIFFNTTTQDHEGGITYDMDHEQHQLEVNKYYMHGGSSTIDQHEFLPISHDPALPTHVENHVETDDHEGNNYGGLKFTITCKQEEIKNENEAENGGPVKWMSSKMRLMRKMMTSDPDRPPRMVIDTTQKSQDQHQPISPNSSNSNNTTIRVCSDCNTTKTPLWRSGPRGPKSLCNACGIRQRKARRAMAAAAAAAANGAILAPSTTSTSDASSMKTNKVQQYKKRCKITAPRSKKKICLEDLTINLSKSSAAFHGVFPQDEKEAAILLMALSCGLVHG